MKTCNEPTPKMNCTKRIVLVISFDISCNKFVFLVRAKLRKLKMLAINEKNKPPRLIISTRKQGTVQFKHEFK